MAGSVERLADGADAAVHHVGGGDHVRTRFRLKHGGAGNDRHTLVVHDDAVAEDSIVAVIGKRVERRVGDDADLRHGRLDGARRPAHQVVGVQDLRRGPIAERHVDIGEDGERRDAELCAALRFARGKIGGKTLNPGHGADRLPAVLAVDHEDRPDQVVDGERGLTHEAARPVGAAVAAQPTAAGDAVDVREERFQRRGHR